VAERPESTPADARPGRDALPERGTPGPLAATEPSAGAVRRSAAPLAAASLIALNAIAYLLAIGGGGSPLGGPTDATLVAYGAIPYELTHPASHCALGLLGANVLCTGQAGVIGAAGAQPATWETVFTSMFISAGALRLVGAMVALAFFAWSVEGVLGAVAPLVIYLAGGLVALAAAVVAGPDSTVALLGAGGAVAALAGAYGALQEGRRVRTLAILLAFLALAELPSLAGLGAGAVRSGAGTALEEHLAALAAGFLLGLGFAARRRRQVRPARTE
jgi:membrane associated rhomboid family serine protease